LARCYDYADCFQDAPPGSLWCDHCRAERAKIHERLTEEKVALVTASIRAYNEEQAARTEVECEGRCGRLVPNARRRQAEDVEQLRRQVQRKLMTGQVQVDGGPVTDSFAAYCRAIELTAPHRLQQARNLCDDCLQAKMKDAVIFLGEHPSAPAAAPMKGEDDGEPVEAARSREDE